MPRVEAYLKCAVSFKYPTKKIPIVSSNYLFFFSQSCMATWNRIRFVMSFALAWSLVLIGMSAYEMKSDEGAIRSVVNADQTSLGGWAQLCYSEPYIYVRPFAFTIDGQSAKSYCPWPDVNSQFRITIAVLSFVTTLALYFYTPLSWGARTLWLFYTAFYFAIFVLDANAAVVGLELCYMNFKGTTLSSYLGGSAITCIVLFPLPLFHNHIYIMYTKHPIHFVQ